MGFLELTDDQRESLKQRMQARSVGRTMALVFGGIDTRDERGYWHVGMTTTAGKSTVGGGGMFWWNPETDDLITKPDTSPMVTMEQYRRHLRGEPMFLPEPPPKRPTPHRVTDGEIATLIHDANPVVKRLAPRGALLAATRATVAEFHRSRDERGMGLVCTFESLFTPLMKWEVRWNCDTKERRIRRTV